MTEAEPVCILRSSREKPELFAVFYRRYFDSVLAFLVRRIYDVEAALDLAAESFAQAYVARHRFRGNTRQEEEAWIFRIAQRQLTRYLRRGKLERQALKRLGMEVPRLDDDARVEIDKLADLQGLRGLLRAELARLSEPQREALQLRIVAELPYAEVANRLQVSEQAARLRVSRGLRSLAEALEGDARWKELHT